MTHQLYTHLKKFIEVDEKNFPEILSYFKLRSLNKKEIVMKAGEKCNSNFFVLSGCLHLYCINDKGTEQTIQFGIENWWITDFLAFHHQSVATYLGLTPEYLSEIKSKELS